MISLISSLNIARDAVLWGDPQKSSFTAFTQATTANAVRSVVSAEEAEKVMAMVKVPLEGPWRWSLYFDGTSLHVRKIAVCNAPSPGGKPS